MKPYLIILISLWFTFTACRQNKIQPKRNNEISKVCLATGGCYGKCPFMAIEIDSSLNYRFLGVKYAKREGLYVGEVTQGFWDTLNMKFESVNYKQLDTMYEHSIDDLSTELIIHYNNKRKRVIGQSISLPDSLRKIYRLLMNTYTRFELNKSTDTIDIKFETRIQNGLPPPPMQFIHQLKVIPPETKQ